jgi:cysteine desulfurase
MNTHIYLDYAATTPIDRRVVDTMQPLFEDLFGNPSSLHFFGQRAETVLEESRRNLALNLGADPKEIIFTSCGSESDNLALRGTALARKKLGGYDQIAISPVEHPAVQVTAQQLATQHGFELVYLPVDHTGQVLPDRMEESLNERTALVSVMGANNEIGTINPIAEIARICRQRRIPFHCDALQYAAHIPLKVEELGVDLLSLGAHKFYGPKGVGLLYVREGTQLTPVQTGGSQEFGLRAATENVPLIAGMARAYQLVQEESAQRIEHLLPLRDLIINRVLDEIPGSKLTGAGPENRLPNHTSFVFKNLDGNLLIQVLDSEGFACSSGSACKTGDPRPSSVLTTLGYSPDWSLGSLRVTLGKDTSLEDVNRFLAVLPDCIQRTREAA